MKTTDPRLTGQTASNLKTWIASGFKERHTSPMVDVGMITKAKYKETARASIRDLIATCRSCDDILIEEAAALHPAQAQDPTT